MSESGTPTPQQHHTIFRLRTLSTTDDGPMSKEGQMPKEGGQKGKVIGVFTSGGDSQGIVYYYYVVIIIVSDY